MKWHRWKTLPLTPYFLLATGKTVKQARIGHEYFLPFFPCLAPTFSPFFSFLLSQVLFFDSQEAPNITSTQYFKLFSPALSYFALQMFHLQRYLSTLPSVCGVTSVYQTLESRSMIALDLSRLVVHTLLTFPARVYQHQEKRDSSNS